MTAGAAAEVIRAGSCARGRRQSPVVRRACVKTGGGVPEEAEAAAQSTLGGYWVEEVHLKLQRTERLCGGDGQAGVRGWRYGCAWGPQCFRGGARSALRKQRSKESAGGAAAMEMRRVKNIAHPLRPNAWHIAAPSRGALRTPSKTVIAESTRPARLTATTTATMERSPAQVPPPSPLRSRFRSCDFARFAPPCGPPHNPPWPPHGAALVHIGGLSDEHTHLPSLSSSWRKRPRVWTWSSPLCTCAGGGQPTLTLNPNPRTLTLNPTPYTQHPTSYIPHPTCRTLHPAPRK